MGRLLVVDAENVRRSVWPNVGRDELVGLCGRHAGASGEEVLVVFDGAPPAGPPPPGVRVAGEPGRSADDLIAELAAGHDGEVAVATSDRGLRARLPGGVATVGGGRFVRLLTGRGD